MSEEAAPALLADRHLLVGEELEQEEVGGRVEDEVLGAEDAGEVCQESGGQSITVTDLEPLRTTRQPELLHGQTHHLVPVSLQSQHYLTIYIPNTLLYKEELEERVHKHGPNETKITDRPLFLLI